MQFMLHSYTYYALKSQLKNDLNGQVWLGNKQSNINPASVIDRWTLIDVESCVLHFMQIWSLWEMKKSMALTSGSRWVYDLYMWMKMASNEFVHLRGKYDHFEESAIICSPRIQAVYGLWYFDVKTSKSIYSLNFRASNYDVMVAILDFWRNPSSTSRAKMVQIKAFKYCF